MRLCLNVRLRALAAVCVLVISQGRAAADVLLSDNFSGPSLDTSKWYTVLPFANSSVVQQNGHVELANRGYLVTQGQFSPASAVGGLHIQGQYTFLNTSSFSLDFLQIVTRTAAIPDTSFGEATQGLSFTIRGDNQLRVHDRATGATLVGPVPIRIDNGQTYNFDIRDDGLNFSFSVQEVGGDASASLSGTSNISSAINHVAFYNREFLDRQNVGFLQNVVLSDDSPGGTAIPEPGSFVLLALGIAACACWRPRRILAPAGGRS
jgi:hypothetical protein